MKLTTTKLSNLREDLESLAKQDGVQRGVFFDTSGNARAEAVSATAQHSWLYKTKAGQPFKWGINE